MPIDRNDWPDMPKEQSFINCQSLYHYTPSELSDAKPRGRLSDDTLDKLLDHAGGSDTLVERDIDIVIDALRGYLGK